jgi:hypothetical protein
MGLEVQLPAAPLSTIGGTAGSTPVAAVPSTPVSATAAVNTAVTLTINGVAGQSIRITMLAWSYTGTPSGGNITVVVNGVTIFQQDISSGAGNTNGDGYVPLPAGGLECQAGQSAVITLAAAGAAVAGRLNAASYYGA